MNVGTFVFRLTPSIRSYNKSPRIKWGEKRNFQRITQKVRLCHYVEQLLSISL